MSNLLHKKISKSQFKPGLVYSSSVFSKVYFESVLKIWERKLGTMGIPLIDIILYILSFTDKQLVISQDYDDLNLMARKLIREY